MIDQQGLYIISVAARLLDMHPQTLRKYERAGFLTPNRTGGMLRLYSAEDIQRLQLIKHLVEELGLNLAGVELGLALHQLLGKLQEDVENIEDADELRKRVKNGLEKAEELLGARRPASERHGARSGGRTTVRITQYRLHHADGHSERTRRAQSAWPSRRGAGGGL